MRLFTFLIAVCVNITASGYFFSDSDEKISLLNYRKMVQKHWPENPDSALYYAHLQLNLAEKVDDQEMYEKAVWSIGFINNNIGRFEEAATYLFKANELFKKSDNLKQRGICLYNIGQIFMSGKDYENAILFFKEALSIHEKVNNTKSVANTYYELARCFYYLEDHTNASLNLTTAIKLIDEENPELLSKAHNYLGAIFLKEEKYDKAISEFKSSIDYATGLDDFSKKSAIAYNNIGETYLTRGDLVNAEIYLKKAVDLKIEINDPNFTLSTLLLISKLEQKKGNIQNALVILENGIIQADHDVVNHNMLDALNEITFISQNYISEIKLTSTNLLAYLKVQNQQVNLIRDLNDRLDKHKNQYLLKNVFETHQLAVSKEDLDRKLQNSIIYIVLLGIIILIASYLSYYYIRRYKLLNAFHKETSLGLELINHQLERTIKIATKNK